MFTWFNAVQKWWRTTHKSLSTEAEFLKTIQTWECTEVRVRIEAWSSTSAYQRIVCEAWTMDQSCASFSHEVLEPIWDSEDECRVMLMACDFASKIRAALPEADIWLLDKQSHPITDDYIKAMIGLGTPRETTQIQRD